MIEKNKDYSKNILEAAKWCFLNFGYAKTSMEDVAKRAKVSRALIYKRFKNKEEIALDVFNILFEPNDKLMKKIAASNKSKQERLMEICDISVVSFWEDIAGAPMAEEFSNVCELIEPEICTKYEKVMLDVTTKILGDKEIAKLFILSLDGLMSDMPSVDILKKRIQGLVKVFASAEF